MKKIFVFGSNLEGRHGKGAALEARQKWGAVYGQAIGLHGNSYAIPTKETPYKSLPLDKIHEFVIQFCNFAYENPMLQFILTPIGCGLAGYTPEQIAPMFDLAPGNVVLPSEFEDYLKEIKYG